MRIFLGILLIIEAALSPIVFIRCITAGCEGALFSPLIVMALTLLEIALLITTGLGFIIGKNYKILNYLLGSYILYAFFAGFVYTSSSGWPYFGYGPPAFPAVISVFGNLRGSGESSSFIFNIIWFFLLVGLAAFINSKNKNTELKTNADPNQASKDTEIPEI